MVGLLHVNICVVCLAPFASSASSASLFGTPFQKSLPQYRFIFSMTYYKYRQYRSIPIYRMVGMSGLRAVLYLTT